MWVNGIVPCVKINIGESIKKKGKHHFQELVKREREKEREGKREKKDRGEENPLGLKTILNICLSLDSLENNHCLFVVAK